MPNATDQRVIGRNEGCEGPGDERVSPPVLLGNPALQATGFSLTHPERHHPRDNHRLVIVEFKL